MEERQVRGWILCCWNQYNSISKIWSHHRHHFQEGHFLLDYNWQYPLVHMPGLPHIVLSGSRKEGVMSDCKHLYYVFKCVSNVDYDNKHIHSCSNVYLQWGYALIWTCQCCWMRIVMLVSCAPYRFKMFGIDTMCFYITKQPNTPPNTLLICCRYQCLDYCNKNQQLTDGFSCIPWQSTPFKTTFQNDCPM